MSGTNSFGGPGDGAGTQFGTPGTGLSPQAYRPRVGITTYLQRGQWGVWDEQGAILPRTYLDAVVQAGGTPVLLPPVWGDGSVDVGVLDILDGLILSGGPDVDPARYGAEPHEHTFPDPARDTFEMALGTEALDRGLPLFAICRGAQVINVARGGTLNQHIPDLLPHTQYQPAPATFGTARVRSDGVSRTLRILGTESSAPVYHHQSIAQVGAGLTITARDEFGTVEAFEADSPGWNIAVQFHPEQNPDDLRLFEAFVEASREWAMGRSEHPMRGVPNDAAEENRHSTTTRTP